MFSSDLVRSAMMFSTDRIGGSTVGRIVEVEPRGGTGKGGGTEGCGLSLLIEAAVTVFERCRL
jgi:hypothetical protein